MESQVLTPDDCAEPFALYDAWLDDASSENNGEVNDPSAAALASIGADGFPSARIVLVRGRDEAGFHFFTNYTSRKASELDAHGKGALCFHWKSLRRQVRAVGVVERLDAADSDAYYGSRPYGSRIGAWASKQSAVLESRAVLHARVIEMEARYPDAPPRPDFWGGYRLIPHEMEFWMEGDFRLHDRWRFLRDNDGGWRVDRLYP